MTFRQKLLVENFNFPPSPPPPQKLRSCLTNKTGKQTNKQTAKQTNKGVNKQAYKQVTIKQRALPIYSIQNFEVGGNW